jgi:AraC-like DNA-binding protein
VAAVHHARRLASLAVRAILVEDEPVGPTLRAILPHPVNLAADVMEWLEVRGSAPPPECRALVGAIIQLAPRYRTLTAVLTSIGRSEEAGRPRARSRCPIPPSHWFAASQALHAALALQADPDRPLLDAALDLGYSDASSLSRQMVRVFGLRPGVARSVIGWEPLLDRWLALEAGEARPRPAWASSLDTPDDQRPPSPLVRPDLGVDRGAERASIWTTEVRPRRAER